MSKTERVYKIKNLQHVQIILNGEVKGANDTTRYHLKFTINNGDSFLFGQTLTMEKILEKVTIYTITPLKVSNMFGITKRYVPACC